MKLTSDQLRLAATDLSNHLACRHLTTLDVSVARGERQAPEFRAPDAVVIQQLGLRHEEAYLQFLRSKGAALVNLKDVRDDQRAVAETLSCMEAGASNAD